MYIHLMYVCRLVISIGGFAFQSSGLRSVSFPSSVTFIGMVTIREEKIIKKLYFLSSVVVLIISIVMYRQGAFCYCRSLREVSLPTSLRSIPDSFLLRAGALQSIVIPS